MGYRSIEVRNLLTSNANVCISKDDEFVIPDFLLDEVAKCMIKHDSHFLTDAFDDGSPDGLEIFILSLMEIVFMGEGKGLPVKEILEFKELLITRLRSEAESYCSKFETDVREAIEEHQKEVKSERTITVLTPFNLQMKILADGMDRVLGTEDKK